MLAFDERFPYSLVPRLVMGRLVVPFELWSYRHMTPCLRTPRVFFSLVVPLLLALSFGADRAIGHAGGEEVTKANYDLAAKFSPARIGKMTFDFTVNPRWIRGTENFWYSYETSDGRFFWLVDPVNRTKVPLFDNVKMAAALTRITMDPYDHQHLPIRTVKFVKDGRAFQFKVVSTQDEEPEEEKEGTDKQTDDKKTDDKKDTDEKKDGDKKPKKKRKKKKKKVFWFEYDLATRSLQVLEDHKEPDDRPSWASISPDGEHVVFSRDHNLYMIDKKNYEKFLAEKKKKDEEESGAKSKDKEEEDEIELEETQLTEDGVEHYTFGTSGRGQTDKEREKMAGKRQRAGRIVWARDSKKFAIIRTDMREVGELWVVDSTAEPRPTLESYKYAMPGEKEVGKSELYVFDVESNKRTLIKADRFKDQSPSVVRARQFRWPDDENPPPSQWLSDDSTELFFGRISRDLKRYDLCIADTESGDVKVLIEERLNTYVEIQNTERLASTGELIHWSERDGWGHYYLYDREGKLKNQITSGPFSCRRILHVDENRRVIYFSANGREEGEDPYFTHLYRVHLDGSGLRLLNEGDFNRQSIIGASGRFFVDNYSRVDTTPASALYDNDGQRLLDLESSDFSLLDEVGFRFPRRFTVKAADSVTDLYGVMYTPIDMDKSKKYPIIAYVYPGPQTEAVPKSFSTSASNMALAQLGFVVIAVGNRGGHPARSKWYHNYGYGNLRDYGLADKKVAIERLANRHDFIDIDRVGIYGHSGGGFMSTAAMLVYPDFFKVAVSSAGNHDNNVYNRWWSEKHHGVKEVVDDEGNVTFEYDIDKNSELAKNLKGRLLLTTGDIDNNVHPAGTLRMAKTLIKANKRFDFFIFPGQRHGFGDMSNYWFWLRADYFCEHLLGDHDRPVDMVELNREKELSR